LSKGKLIIGSRGSALALWQAREVASSLEKIGIATEIRIIKTTGDHLQAASLSKLGGKGLFTKEIEDALLAGEIDVAVHSLKDLPTQSPAGLAIAAVPEREDPHDVLVGHTLRSLPSGARVGTSSVRRSAQLLALRPDVQPVSIRGNVDTRLRKLKESQYDAILLAAAGLRRLGFGAEISYYFASDEICPAPGQGALGIQTRDSGQARDLCAALNHEASARAVTCERTLLAELGGGCQLPVGAFAALKGDQLYCVGVVASPDGSRVVRGQANGPIDYPDQVGKNLASQLLSRGAAEILEAVNAMGT
jgi:hydroxymethylbilane synthase